MYIYLLIFIFGTVFASFIHLYATRLMKGESIVVPRSHCTMCNHVLKWYELIPIVSFIAQRGRCRICNQKIGIDSLVIEVMTGILFVIVYYLCGPTYDCILGFVLVLIAMSIFVTDFKDMIILDSTLLVGTLVIYVILFLDKGLWSGVYKSLLYGIFAFVLMFLIKIIGDAIFKRESLGGGDIKFAFLMGSVLPYNLFLISLVLASVFALPYALFVSFKSETNELAFGPFLALGLLVTFLLQSNIIELLNILVG